MFKYTHSDNLYNPWIELSKSSFDDKINVINKYYMNNYYVYDADYCGNNVKYFAFSDNTYFKIDYSWWIIYDPEWEINNEYNIIEISKDEAMKYLTSDRDWLKIDKWS